VITLAAIGVDPPGDDHPREGSNVDISYGTRWRFGVAVALAFIVSAVPTVAIATVTPEQPPTASPLTAVGLTTTIAPTITAAASPSAVVADPPSIPLSVTAVPLDHMVRLSWAAPESPGTSPITGYDIAWCCDGGWQVRGVSASARSEEIITLQLVPHYFRMRAYNSAGASPWTTSVMAIPIASPSVPRSVTATPGFNQATVRWTAPASTGGSPIQGYTIGYARAGGTWTSVNVPASTRSRTFTGLRGGSTYYFHIAAFSAVGRSVWSASVRATLKAYGVPGAVSIYSVTVGNQAVTLRWSKPDTGGLPITRYLVQIGSRGVWRKLAFVSGGTRAYTVTGLLNGRTYSFRVRAANALGWGPFV
jgi:fibronectin type III domain protein